MIRFVQLFEAIDATTKTNEKIAALVRYFSAVSPEDAAWAIYLLSGQKLKQIVPTKLLRKWAAEEANIPTWLFDESYHSVGDLAETIALIVPPGNEEEELSLTAWIRDRLQPVRTMSEDAQRQAMTTIWQQTPVKMRLVLMKLLTGLFESALASSWW